MKTQNLNKKQPEVITIAAVLAETVWKHAQECPGSWTLESMERVISDVLISKMKNLSTETYSCKYWRKHKQCVDTNDEVVCGDSPCEIYPPRKKES
jgi:hypothetical protein